MVLDRFEPPTWLQFVSTPVNTFFRPDNEMLEMLFDLLTSMHSASRNSLSKMVPESASTGAAVWMANSERPVWTSVTPALPPSGL